MRILSVWDGRIAWSGGDGLAMVLAKRLCVVVAS